MFNLTSTYRYYLYDKVCDMRKGFDGLSGLVRAQMNLDPCNGDAFIFINRSGKHIKLLHWERGGFVLYHKRLEVGRFILPVSLKYQHVFSWRELILLVDGVIIEKQRFSARYPK